MRGQLARRRRRGPEGLRAASGAPARNVPPEGPPGDRPELCRARVRVTLARRLPRERWPAGSGALRAPLKYVEIVITRSDNTRCRRLSAESFRWSGVQCDALAIGRASATSVYEFQLMLYTASQSGIRLRDLTAGGRLGVGAGSADGLLAW